MSVRARLERVERNARARLRHVGLAVAGVWADMPAPDLEALARVGAEPEAVREATDAAAVALAPNTAQAFDRIADALEALDHLPHTDTRWHMPLPQPSDEAIREALDVLDASPPAGELVPDARALARIAARVVLVARDA